MSIEESYNPMPGDPNFLEEMKNHLEQTNKLVGGMMLSTIGTIVFLLGMIVHPFIHDEPNIFEKINNKYKLFRWNEDC